MTACSDSCPSSWLNLSLRSHSMVSCERIPGSASGSCCLSLKTHECFFLFKGRNYFLLFFLKLWLNVALHLKHLWEHGCYCRGMKGILYIRHKIALWTETRTSFRKTNKYICALEKWIQRVKSMKRIKFALAHRPWKIHRSHYNAPNKNFSASYTTSPSASQGSGLQC